MLRSLVGSEMCIRDRDTAIGDVYLNGKEGLSTTGATTAATQISTAHPNKDVLLGCGLKHYGSHRWLGQIDEFQLYHRRLDKHEIQELYKAGRNCQCKSCA
eukprot:TRINITY_DN37288_c0_g1_i1.p2 TRINITY_DN37288_c0_g1~~TRINITY_DN37288_c0_g1_i1.p2  ORF type:complete len:101 (-),score=24.67 TRINITY_DN37288_c0_g1_i1:352-654(-)